VLDASYNSCRNRHCPKCQASAAYRWLETRQADLLPVPYYHVVFTLPAAISDIAFTNKAAVYGALFKAVSQTLLTIGADPKHLGAKLGATLVLHTWGSAMAHHPHIHGIVPGGGLSPDGTRRVDCRANFFLPVRVLSALFRRLMCGQLAKLHAAGELKFFGHNKHLVDQTAFTRLLQRERRRDWVVYAKRPFSGPDQVLAYLDRYTHRIAISNSMSCHRGSTASGISASWPTPIVQKPLQRSEPCWRTGYRISTHPVMVVRRWQLRQSRKTPHRASQHLAPIAAEKLSLWRLSQGQHGCARKPTRHQSKQRAEHDANPHLNPTHRLQTHRDPALVLKLEI